MMCEITNYCTQCEERIKRIEELEAEVADWKEGSSVEAARADELQAENERLREELKGIPMRLVNKGKGKPV
jgi:uncharacterized coiled-coil DUF342 family protein